MVEHAVRTTPTEPGDTQHRLKLRVLSTSAPAPHPRLPVLQTEISLGALSPTTSLHPLGLGLQARCSDRYWPCPWQLPASFLGARAAHQKGAEPGLVLSPGLVLLDTDMFPALRTCWTRGAPSVQYINPLHQRMSECTLWTDTYFYGTTVTLLKTYQVLFCWECVLCWETLGFGVNFHSMVFAMESLYL